MFRNLSSPMTRVPRRFREMDQDASRMMERFFGPLEEWWNGAGPNMPIADVAETDAAVEVTVELPGMKPDEVTVELRGNELWVTGEKKSSKEEPGKTFHRIERTFGRFERMIPLPTGVRDDAVDATFENGVLTVVLPKAPETKRRPIEVKHG